MQRVALGFMLGLVAGVAAGWILGAAEPPADLPHRVVEAGPATAGAAPDTNTNTTPGGRRVRVDPRTGQATRRTRSGPSGSVPPTPTKGRAVKTPPPAADSAEAALAALTAIARGAPAGTRPPRKLVSRIGQSDLVVPWETVLALVSGGYVDAAEAALTKWPNDLLRRALVEALDDEHPDLEALRELASAAAAQIGARAPVDRGQVDALTLHADPRLRRAGVGLAYEMGIDGFDRLLDMAENDSDESVRTSALEWAAWMAYDLDSEGLRERALPAILHSARHGSLELRRMAIESLSDAGPGAVAVTLEIFQEEGVDPSLQVELAAGVVNGGRLGDLLGAARTRAQRGAIAAALINLDDVSAETIRRYARQIAALAPDVDESEEAYDLYALLVDAGEHAIVAAAATNRRLPLATRSSALDVLLQEEEPAIIAAGVDAAREVLLGGAGDVLLRRHAVEYLQAWDWTSLDEGLDSDLAKSIREILVAVAAKDANSWVRGMAAEALAEWDE